MNWKNYFKLTELEEDDGKYFTRWGSHLVNENYIGDDVEIFYSSPKKIENFLTELEQINPNLLNYIKEVDFKWGRGNEFRGSFSDESYIKGSRKFFEEIKFSSCFKWIDRAWGDWTSRLEYNKEALNKYK